MATDNEMRAAGIHLPAGSDYISEGDDAISENARVLWERIEGARFDRTATPLKETDDVHSLPAGRYGVWNGGVATAIGLPEANIGVIDVARFGSGVAIIEYRPRTLDGARIWQQTLFGSTWLGWERVDAGAVRIDPQDTMRRGFRTVPLALTRGRGAVSKPAAGSVRFPTGWAAPVTRWRIRMQNVNPRYGTVGAGSHEVTGFWVGDHAGGGAMSSMVQVHGSAVIPNSTEWVSPWLTEPITGDRMLSLGWTSTGGTPIGIQGGCWQTSSAADAGTSAPTRTIQQTAPFSIWIEAETYASTPVVAVAGDSLSVGANATLPIHDSVISVHAREVGALPVHYAASGDSMAASLDPDHFKWQQFADCDAPDSILWAMGSNDVFGGPTLAEMQERHEDYAAVLATITPNIYAATIAPRTSNQDAGITATRRAYNTWLETHPNGIRDVFDFVTPVSADDLTLRTSVDADGTHYNSTGYAAQAAAITRPITPGGRLPPAAVAHVQEMITGAAPYVGPWRDITALFDPAVVSAVTGVRVRRYADRIEYTVSSLRLTGTAGTIVPWGSLPAGYRPSWSQYGGLQSTTGVGALDITVNTGGGLVATGGSSSATYRGTFTVYTTAAPPTTHPGDPA